MSASHHPRPHSATPSAVARVCRFRLLESASGARSAWSQRGRRALDRPISMMLRQSNAQRRTAAKPGRIFFSRPMTGQSVSKAPSTTHSQCTHQATLGTWGHPISTMIICTHTLAYVRPKPLYHISTSSATPCTSARIPRVECNPWFSRPQDT